jgi:hypothetical protein
MGAGSANQVINRNGGVIRDTMRRHDLVQLQRGVLANRSTERSGVPPAELLSWADRTPGAGHAARRLARQAGVAEQRADWARGVYNRALQRDQRITQGDVKVALDNPHLVRWLVAVRPDMYWMESLFDQAVIAGNLAAVAMMLEDPWRAPPRNDEFTRAARLGHFDIALMFLANGYRPTRMAGEPVGQPRVPPARARCMEPVLEGVEKAIMTRADLRGVPPLVVHIVGCSAPPAPTRGFLSDVLPHDLCTNMMFTVGLVANYSDPAIGPAAFSELDGADADAAAYGAVDQLLDRRWSSPAERADWLARLRPWMAHSVQATARVAVKKLLHRGKADTIVESGMADVLREAGFVDVGHSSVTFRNGAGRSVDVSRADSPAIDAWAKLNAAQGR